MPKGLAVARCVRCSVPRPATRSTFVQKPKAIKAPAGSNANPSEDVDMVDNSSAVCRVLVAHFVPVALNVPPETNQDEGQEEN